MIINNIKASAIVLVLMVWVSTGCSDSTCKDPLALNLNVDDDCKYSKAAFYATSSRYYDPNFNLYDVTKVELLINGKSQGVITKFGAPNNCSAPGVVNFQFVNGETVDWAAIVSLTNGSSVTYTGTADPSPSNPCITVRVD